MEPTRKKEIKIAKAILSKMTDEQVKDFYDKGELPAMKLSKLEMELIRGGKRYRLRDIFTDPIVCPFPIGTGPYNPGRLEGGIWGGRPEDNS